MFRLPARLPGYTLVELLMVLILTALLVAMVTGTFYYVNTFRQQISAGAEPVVEAQKLNYLLSADTHQARKIYRQSSILLFLAAYDTVFYDVQPDMIVRRQQAVADTFRVSSTLQGLRISDGLVEHFNLVLTYRNNRRLTFSYRKQYGSTDYYRADLTRENTENQ